MLPREGQWMYRQSAILDKTSRWQIQDMTRTLDKNMVFVLLSVWNICNTTILSFWDVPP
jgi:hypothetical protein